MAGKSTFLRSLGVNYILAMSGMPVFAGSLKVSRFQLFSSMRTTDDLTHGISYFNAELLRLEQLMQFCKRGDLLPEGGVLFLGAQLLGKENTLEIGQQAQVGQRRTAMNRDRAGDHSHTLAAVLHLLQIAG